ncbi:alpha-(1,3)-fucosyltransferase 7-like [Leguminivora glycinivorella]|uniref:alpha-(1,3)-fucosyltransferase 7-like n=1 Tax=Leguminivora glycinivorella TaxID=1035111 RepID=UPI00200F9FEE|nr:alpha-(1,3)-fucosyltransferase 7-like [Leguminivora glycinivorella]
MIVIYILHARRWTIQPHTIVPVADINYSLAAMEEHESIVKNFYEDRKDWVTTNLGTYLFKLGFRLNNTIWKQNLNRVYNILIWKHWDWLEHRHINGFSEHNNNTLYGCSVSNCRFSSDDKITSADVVMIQLQKGELPEVERRDPSQLWIFWIDESPVNTFALVKAPPNYEHLSNIFNWSMTYRTDSDVPIPYGRTLPLSHPKTPFLKLENRNNNFTIKILEELVPFWKDKQRNVLATIMISHCVPRSIRFLLNLKKHLNIDIYGRCADEASLLNRCPGHFHDDCKYISRYLFYLVIENSSCRQYITEKSFYHAYGKGAIPIFVGPFIEDCNKLLPPNSFLHIDNFKTLEDLAAEITAISRNFTKLLLYHTWRNHFKIVNEHGFFKTMSKHLCRICEALNYNQRLQKVYSLDDIRRFLDPGIQCN